MEIDENLYLFSLPLLRRPLEAILQNSSASEWIENGQNSTYWHDNSTIDPNMTVFSTLPINLSEPIEIVLAQTEIQWRHPALAILMASFCIITVTGNCLVVAAVCTKRYLRNPTGYLIVSLAVADLIVGLIVMPLNSLFEMTRHVWLLGLTMCDLFHALDILASTSSIWNLCVISLDRYMAGQDPIGYRDKVSTKRIMIAIFFVWIMSACLSFPAIIFWRQTSPHLYTDQSQCLFTDSRLYVVFSSLVSFYIPLCLILYAYGSVYLIATRHSRSLKRGMKKVTRRKKRKTDKGSDRKGSEEHGTALRIHVGRAKQGSIVASLVGAATANAAVPHRAYGSFYVARQLRVPGDNEPSNNKGDKQQLSNKPSSPLSRHASFVTPNTAPPTYSNSSEIPLLKPDSSSCVDSWSANRHKTSSDSNASTVVVNGNGKVLNRLSSNTSIIITPENGGDLPNGISARSQKVLMKRLGVREKSRQMMRYVQEQRAARTLSVVVGAFILCWMPFFIFSPLISYCSSCIGNQETVFSVITWAGHLNSMLNPLIYSRFSREFRRAFKQILTCQRNNRTKLAFKTPLSVVFAQLVSITHLWETTQATDSCPST